VKYIKKSGLFAAFAAVAVMSLLAVPSHAQTFPAGPADDNTTSLGSYRIQLTPKFAAMVGDTVLESGILYDGATVIGRSDPHLDNPNPGSPDFDGTPVGNAGTIISDARMPVRPPGFNDQGTREVHTEVYALNMTGGGTAVRAGPGAIPPVLQMSPGEVESKTVGGDDFPAESFFDVFVEVDIPPVGTFPGGTVYNQYPEALLVYADTLKDPPGLPPRVIYVHGNTFGVWMHTKNNDPGGAWRAGELFGWMDLAGHAVSYTDSLEDINEFEEFMGTVEPMPKPPPVIPSLTPYGMIILLVLLIISGLWVWRAKRRTATA